MKRLTTFIALLVLSNTAFAAQNGVLDYLSQALGVGNSFSALKAGFSDLFLQMQVSSAVVLMALIFVAIAITSLSMILRWVGYDPLESFKRGELVEAGSSSVDPDQVGEFVRLSDGSFVSLDDAYLGYSEKGYELVNKWLDFETTTMVHFNNAEFDYQQRELFNDPEYHKQIEKLRSRDDSIAAWIDADFDQWRQAGHYDDDVWSGRSSSSIMGTHERYVSMNEGIDDDIPDSFDDLLDRSEREYD